MIFLHVIIGWIWDIINSVIVQPVQVAIALVTTFAGWFDQEKLNLQRLMGYFGYFIPMARLVPLLATSLSLIFVRIVFAIISFFKL